ncbi:hypothetical protein CcaverHIS002_0607220 [Cutaneotrichosporon cavernicola]|uniref:RRM domain-containing protein n=1 Tax=Cutaneotrichosporon cavernicola TaxID=279322 RepID=A0AA48L962_9TREE|nr:uncharacterized protein CcaverHIS019_0606640 [Cutaneotrichosporon cavernicola]BEI86435.1 hypothetical protein CcaverHIS002_0607220 [Cutaneotrichosporon cavernicola]BEI94205.1 hypothetical protein CcaverHIS019_0606640 [Cutaneotrichosporon cavernicola]BEJ01985.1 hypothetical protein CcaverHIS631_0606670 [Cutaneotrichosporon cavernicola]BEJ09748.1 hypothetical protein CcaverHIS641_0606630 [Cutaneotrichosporon cavernicola]
MSDFDHDLYGDLDLEDLDATQLDEELVDPDTLDAPEPPAPMPDSRDVASSSGASDAVPAFDAHAAARPHHIPQGIDRMKPSDMPDEGKMFIGGLNWETTDEGLRAYFIQFGEIEQCTIMRDPTGRSRGFAFLTFRDPASVTKVLEQNHQLDGKMIDPKRAIPRAEHERTAKVFVGGLAASVTSESLKIFLGRFGKVMDATVMFDRLNGRSKGFAFATFAEEAGVDNAMQHSGIELEGRAIEIKKAQPRGAGTQVKAFTAPGGARTSGFNATSNVEFGMGFDPSAMAMMYNNMAKGQTMGMGGGFDPNAMAMMYTNMMKNMGMNGGAPAINPNMARGMGGMGGGMAMGNMMGGMGNMMGGMGMGMGMGGMGGGMGGMAMGGGAGAMGGSRGGRQPPNAPRGPAAMRNTGGPSGMAQPMAQSGSGNGSSHGGTGSGPQRYSTQGQQRAKPY